MARQFYLPREQAPWIDYNNNRAITWKRSSNSEQNSYPVDISGMLNSGETCSSVTTENSSGVTISSTTVTSAGVVTVAITAGGSGQVTALVTTSDSRVIPVRMAWRAEYDTNDLDRYS